MILRPAIAANPLGFGQRARPEPELPFTPAQDRRAPTDELKLFATTFAAGFLFVAVLIA